jgi:hypothetical protein
MFDTQEPEPAPEGCLQFQLCERHARLLVHVVPPNTPAQVVSVLAAVVVFQHIREEHGWPGWPEILEQLEVAHHCAVCMGCNTPDAIEATGKTLRAVNLLLHHSVYRERVDSDTMPILRLGVGGAFVATMRLDYPAPDVPWVQAERPALGEAPGLQQAVPVRVARLDLLEDETRREQLIRSGILN